jgi:signal transduction histidine kinase
MERPIANGTGLDPNIAARRVRGVGLLAILAIASALTVMTANECHTNFVISHTSASFTPSLLFGFVTWFWWVGMAIGLWQFARLGPVLRFSTTTLPFHLATACLLGMLHLALLQRTVQWAGVHWPAWGSLYSTLNLETRQRFGIDFVIYGFIYGVSGLLHSQLEAQRTIVQKLELERRLSQAQLRALQMQLEPHFLFNTLNALNSLVDLGRNKEASQALAHLNTILRSALQRKAPEKIPFVEELRVMESYLAIQQVRFADRLQVKIETTPEALEGLVPCFLLQPIVENAIHHGIASLETGGVVETSVKRVGDKLWMQVRDNGAGPSQSPGKGHGIGISSTRERLAYFYPDNHEFAAAARETGGYQVTIQIPFERAKA